MRFKKVVETGSISQASRLLFVTQPALSRSIRLLEDEYGVEILERHPAGVRPTAYGNILYTTACEIERNLLTIEQEILKEKLLHEPTQPHMEINIGCSTIWSDFLIPEVMRTLDRLDSYAINVTNDTSEQLLNDMGAGRRYDFILCRILEERAYRGLQSIPLFQSQPALFINDHHPIFSTGFEKKELLKLKWIKLKTLPVLQQSDLTPEGLSYFPENFFPPEVSIEVEDLITAIQLLRNNYIILLPLALRGILEKYNIKPFPFPKTLTNSYWLGMVHRRDQEFPPHIRELMNSIRIFFSTRR